MRLRKGRNVGLRRGALWIRVGSVHATECGRSVWRTWGSARDAPWCRERGVACGCTGTQRATAQGCGMRLRWCIACGCAGAKHAAALGRGVGPRRCPAWGSGGCSAELRKGRSMVPHRGAARGRTGASRAAGLSRILGLRRGTTCGCARGVTWGCAGAQCALGRCPRLRKGRGVGLC